MATRTIANGGGNSNSTSTWVEGIVPVSGDSVVATATSGQLTVNATFPASGQLLSFDMTGYTNTLTINSGITMTVGGTFKLVSGMTLAGTGSVALNATGTITSGGLTVPYNVTMTGTATYTLGDNWAVSGLVTLGASTLTTTLTSNTLTCSGGLTIGGTTSTVTGTCNIKVTGGTLSSNQTSTGALVNNLEIAGNMTFSGNVRYKTGTFKYTSGTVTDSAGALLIQAATTLDLGGSANVNWDFTLNAASLTVTLASNFKTTGTLTTNGTTTFSGAFTIQCGAFAQTATTTGTITIGGNLTVDNTMTLSNTTSTTFAGSFGVTVGALTIGGTQTLTPAANTTWNVQGTLTASDATVITSSGTSAMNIYGLTTTGNITGTQKLVFNGTGTWTGAAGSLANNCDINTSGTLTLSGTFIYTTGTLTYVAGTISAGSSTLSISGSCTIDSGGMTGSNAWANVTITAALTLTLPSTLNASGTLTGPNANVTFAGSGGFSVNTVANTAIASTAKTYTFANLVSYAVTHAFNFSGASTALTLSLTSDHATNKVLMPLTVGSAQDVGFVNPTRINSNGGDPIFSYKGTITNSDNWTNVYAPIVRPAATLMLGV